MKDKARDILAYLQDRLQIQEQRELDIKKEADLIREHINTLQVLQEEIQKKRYLRKGKNPVSTATNDTGKRVKFNL